MKTLLTTILLALAIPASAIEVRPIGIGADVSAVAVVTVTVVDPLGIGCSPGDDLAGFPSAGTPGREVGARVWIDLVREAIASGGSIEVTLTGACQGDLAEVERIETYIPPAPLIYEWSGTAGGPVDGDQVDFLLCDTGNGRRGATLADYPWPDGGGASNLTAWIDGGASDCAGWTSQSSAQTGAVVVYDLSGNKSIGASACNLTRVVACVRPQ